MNQADHSHRDRDRDSGRHQGTLPRRQVDILGAEQVNPASPA